MPDFDPPDAGWTDVYAWTRYRGPDPYPCPLDWVLDGVDGDGIGWTHVEDDGDGHETDYDVREALPDDEELSRDARAFLINEIVEFDQRDPENTRLKHRLSIAGTDVFERVEPATDDLFASVAEALARWADGEDVEQFAGQVEPTTGSPPEGVQSEREIERRREENRGLGDFAADQ